MPADYCEAVRTLTKEDYMVAYKAIPFLLHPLTFENTWIFDCLEKQSKPLREAVEGFTDGKDSITSYEWKQLDADIKHEIEHETNRN